MGVEEVLDAEAAFLLRQPVRRFQPDLQMPVAGLLARERLELHEHRRHQVEGDADVRELAQQRDHAPVVLEGMQPDPGQYVLARRQVLIQRLVHVPQQRDARHNWSTSG